MIPLGLAAKKKLAIVYFAGYVTLSERNRCQGALLQQVTKNIYSLC